MQVVRTSFGFASLQKPPSEVYRKVVITGLGRSGTTAIASLLRYAGFYVGEVEQEAAREDPTLRKMLANGRGAEIRPMLDQWADRHELIAWKDPKLVGNEGRRVVHSLSGDWAVIVTFRDPLATTMRLVTQHGGDLLERLTNAVRAQKKLLKLIEETQKTLLLVSYEKLMSQPNQVCRDLLGILVPDRAGSIDIAALWSKTFADQKLYRRQAALERSRDLGESAPAPADAADEPVVDRGEKPDGKRQPARKRKRKRPSK